MAVAIPAIPALGRQWEEGQKSTARLGFLTGYPLPQKQTKWGREMTLRVKSFATQAQ